MQKLSSKTTDSRGSERMMMAQQADTVKKAQIIKLYLNPTSDKLILEWQTDSSQTGTLTIDDLLGRQLLIKPVISNTGSQDIDVNKLTDGTYIVWLKKAGRAIYQSKVVVIR